MSKCKIQTHLAKRRSQVTATDLASLSRSDLREIEFRMQEVRTACAQVQSAQAAGMRIKPLLATLDQRHQELQDCVDGFLDELRLRDEAEED
jgi:hypothetical protein